MKLFGSSTRSLTSMLATPVMVAGAFATFHSSAVAQPQLLGETRLSLNERDADVIRIQDCRPRISTIQLRAKTADVNIKALVVRFQDGQTKRLDVRSQLRRGEQTRWIPLGAGDSCVKAIAVLGDSRSNPNSSQARIQFWGDSSWSQASNSDQARLLGSTKLSVFEDDKDVVRVNQCEPRIRSIQLRATNASADLKTLVVRYKNGEVSRFGIQRNLAKNERTGWIDLAKSERCVASIAILGDTRFNFQFSQARVEFWGR